MGLKNTLLLSLIVLSFFTGCTDRHIPATENLSTGKVLEVNQIGGKYQIKGEEILLCSFAETYFIDDYGHISLASCLDFSSEKSKLLSELVHHPIDSPDQIRKFQLPANYSGYQFLASGKPHNKTLPILIAEYQSEFSMNDLSIILWDIENNQVLKKITLSQNFVKAFPEVYRELKGMAQGNFIYPSYFSHLPDFKGRILFTSSDRLRLILPVPFSLISYDVFLESETFTERILTEPNIDNYTPYEFSAGHSGEKTIVNFQEVVGGDMLEYHITNDSIQNFSASPSLAGRPFFHKHWSASPQIKILSHNEYKMTIDFKFPENNYSFQFSLESSYIDIKGIDLLYDKYVILTGQHGDEHATTNSLTKAGSIYVLIIDIESEEIVLSSELFTGNQHRLNSVGLIDGALWLSITHNFGGNHDGGTVRRTTSGRLLQVNLPDSIPTDTQLKMNINNDDISFRPFSGKARIN